MSSVTDSQTTIPTEIFVNSDTRSQFKDNTTTPNLNIYYDINNNDEKDEAETKKKGRNNDLINKFMSIKFPDYEKEEEEEEGEEEEEEKDDVDLLKKCCIMYDYANSLINGNISEKKLAILKFETCLNIIYILYKNINKYVIEESSKSLIISKHMNILLNLGNLYILINKLGFALKMYEEAQLLYDNDKYGFNYSTKINLKSFILRGMADVYIKQEEYVSALGLLEEALNESLKTNDKLTQYQILCTQGRALLDAKQFEKSSLIFERAINLNQNYLIKQIDSYDFDLYRNTALCYSKIAHSFCSIVYIQNTKTYAIKNTKKSIIYWNKSQIYNKKTVQIAKQLYGQYSFQYLQSLYEWSDVLCTKGDYKQSYHIYQNIYKLCNDNHNNHDYQQIMTKTKQMLQTLRPYIVNVNV